MKKYHQITLNGALMTWERECLFYNVLPGQSIHTSRIVVQIHGGTLNSAPEPMVLLTNSGKKVSLEPGLLVTERTKKNLT